MAIPSTIRKPGQFHEFDLVTGAGGLTPLPNPVLLIGTQLGGSAANDEFVEVSDEAAGDLLFVAGSEIAIMVRKAFETGKRIGIMPVLFAAGIADPAGVAAEKTITVAGGPAAEAADIVFRISGRTIRAGVNADDTDTEVAAAIVLAINEVVGKLPITATSAVGVVTLVARQTGVNGNDIVVTVDDVGLSGQTAVVVASVPGVGVADPTTALDNSIAKYFESKAIANHAAADVAILEAHQDEAWAPAAKRWNHAFLAETGTLATANGLSTTADDERIQVITYEDSPALPGEIAASVAVAVSSQEQANFNWDFFDLPLALPPDASVYSDTEIESALAAGSTPLAPNDARDTTQIVRLITTKTTEGGNPFENTKDLATIRGLVRVVRQLDVTFAQQFKGVNKSLQVLNRMRSVAYNVLKLFEDDGVTQNVDALFPQLLVDPDPNIKTRALVNVPESIIPNLHQIVFTHVLFVE